MLKQGEKLYEKYRPRKLTQLVGQEKAVSKLRRFLDLNRGPGGQAFWISGPSGSGKTTLARILAGMVADSWYIEETDAGKLTPARLAAIEASMGTYSMGKGGRAYIFNEAHGLTRQVVRLLLTTLESLPPHVVFIFTTTTDGMLAFEDGQIDASPLFSRCTPVTLTNQGFTPAMARLTQAIARREHMDGQPLNLYVKLGNRCHGNGRGMLQAVQAGDMAVAQ